MRKINTLKNIKYNVFFFVINSLLSFSLRTVIIYNLGIEYSGIGTTLTSVLGVLNITELGIGSAVTFSLYKPLREDNRYKINSIMILYKKLYRIIGIVFLVSCLVITLFVNNFVHSDAISLNEKRGYFIIYSLILVCSYFITYSQIIVNASQKNYIITKITGIFNIAKIITQVIFVIVFKFFIIYLVIELIYTIGSYIYINKFIRKEYNWIDFKRKTKIKLLLKENVDILKNTKNIFLHKLALTIGYKTDTIIISIFSNLAIVAKYSNYTMIFSLLKSVVLLIMGGMTSSIGDLIAEGNKLKIYSIWKTIYLFSNCLATITAFCIYININDLIVVWLGKSFLLDSNVIFFMCIILYLQIIANAIVMFSEGYGLFWDVWAPIVDGIMNFVLSIIFVRSFGFIGVLLGTFISHLCVINTWKPILLFKFGFKKNIKEYLKVLFKTMFFSVTSIYLSSLFLTVIKFNITNLFLYFVIKSCISFLCIIIVYFGISFFEKDHRTIYKHYLKKIMR